MASDDAAAPDRNTTGPRDTVGARDRRRPRPRGRRLVVGAVLAAALLVLVVRATAVDFFSVASGSMEPALQVGDGLLVNRTAAGEVRRGDVVVLDGRGSFLAYGGDGPLDGLLRALHLSGRHTLYVKRVIATGGDRLSCCDGEGRLVLNGHPLEEPYLHPDGPPSEQEFSVHVPEGRIWVMGDHRSVSTDSRALLGAPGGGMVPAERIVGRVDAVVWPPARAHSVDGAAR